MAPSLNKSRFLALGLGFACLATQIGLLVILLVCYKAGGHPRNVIGFIVLIVLLGVIPVGFSFLSAVQARNFDWAAFITALVPAAGMFVANYAWGVHEVIYREPGLYCVVGGPAHPLDLIGQTQQILLPAAWALLVAAVAIALKRGVFALRGLRGAESQKDTQTDDPRAFRRTVVAILSTCVAGMVAYAGYVAFQSMPEQRVAKATRILDSASSTSGDRQWAWRQLWRIQSPASSAVLAKATADQPPPLNVFAACVLASRNDISHLAMVEATLMQSALQGEKQFSMNPGFLLGQIKDPHAAPILSRLMRAPNPQIRQGAVQALRHMKTEDSVEALIGGLNDPDWEVRYLSVIGLAETLGPKDGKGWRPSFNLFKAEEKKYLDHWNAWVVSRPRPAEVK